MSGSYRSNVFPLRDHDSSELHSNCEQCFGLCCVALPYSKSIDFAYDKHGGEPCSKLCEDYRCGIHDKLREKGMRGCTVYECFGAGQKVSQVTFGGKSWSTHPELAAEMFAVFPVMQQLQEMLSYLHEASRLEVTNTFHAELHVVIEELTLVTKLAPQAILSLDVASYRIKVNEWLIRTSQCVRAQARSKNGDGRSTERMEQRLLQQMNKLKAKGKNLIGAKLNEADLRGMDWRGALLIAADLSGADLRYSDLIGADLRDAYIRNADLRGCIFLTQAQVNAAKGNRATKLPATVTTPVHWLD